MLHCLLSDEQLLKLQSSSAHYRENPAFIREDLQMLDAMGYLIQAIPEDLGGLGFSLEQACCQHRRLARYAPNLADAVKWHIYWTGIAADLWLQGDLSCEWLLCEACDGGIISSFEAQTRENACANLNLKAEPVDGGYCITGRGKVCLLPQHAGRFGLCAIDESEPKHIKIIYAFMPLNTQGLVIGEDSNPHGRHSSLLTEVMLDAAFVSEKYVARKVYKHMLAEDSFLLSAQNWHKVVGGVN